MLQDIAPSKLEIGFQNAEISGHDRVFIFDADQVVMNPMAENNPSFTYAELTRLASPKELQLVYLFALDGKNFFLLLNRLPMENCPRLPVQVFRTLKPETIAFAGITAHHLYKWYTNHKYCGRCATAMHPSPTERAMICPQCGQVVYPRISPAIIVGIIDHNRLLMTRSTYGTYRRFALLAGFCEVGETLEETVKREVFEEVGLRVKNIRYYKNQPWGFSESLLVGFFADLDGNDHITIDPNELADAQWFEREEIPPVELNISLTSEMIEAFRCGAIQYQSVESACHISQHT